MAIHAFTQGFATERHHHLAGHSESWRRWGSMAMHQSGFLAKDAQTAMPICGQVGMAFRRA
ncbi:MAG: hypothetical protein ACYCSR_07355 [Thiomonas sp.]